MLNFIFNQYGWIREIERSLYGFSWSIRIIISTILIVGIFPSFYTGLVVKKKGFIYGSVVAFIILVLYIFTIIWFLKTMAGGLELNITLTLSQQFSWMVTFAIAGGASVLVGGFMGLAGEKIRNISNGRK
jgi:hypothetical protein